VPDVPIVDMSADPDAVGAELDEICRAVGFFQITGHGIPDGVAEPAWTMATRFFDLPLEDKLSVARRTPDYPYGYMPLAGESLGQSMTDAGQVTPPDLKEVFNMGPPVRPAHQFADPDQAWAYSPNLWPAVLPELEAAWTAYYEAMRDLGSRLMSLFARGLGLPPGFLAAQTGHGANALRANNYPARDTAALPGQLRAGAHTDYGTLTILRQDTVGGLEVLGPAGTWTGVEPVPGAFVVNIGDLMARWTNDRWRSTLHRVVNPPDPSAAAARRQSMPYFQNANWSAEISCLPTCLEPGEQPRYVPVLAGPHLMGKFRRSVSRPRAAPLAAR
jgi:isopenicillin N synthase-like dioxygenase